MILIVCHCFLDCIWFWFWFGECVRILIVVVAVVSHFWNCVFAQEESLSIVRFPSDRIYFPHTNTDIERQKANHFTAHFLFCVSFAGWFLLFDSIKI